MTRFELARTLGLRSMALSQGQPPNVVVEDVHLAQDTLYVAARELKGRVLDAKVKREDGTTYDVRTAKLPLGLDIYLDTRDGESRSYALHAS